MEPPVPPSVNDGRITRGKPSWSQRRSASFALFTNADAGTSRPILRQASLNHRRSSATLMARNDAPIISTLYFSRTPVSESSTARFNAVCPPTVGSSACGFSLAMISSRYSRVSGSRRSEEHTSELQSRRDLVCRLLLEKKTALQRATEQQRR